jgi:hypothetical protein
MRRGEGSGRCLRPDCKLPAVIDLLMRVTRVSVETMEIVEAMKKEKR